MRYLGSGILFSQDAPDQICQTQVGDDNGKLDCQVIDQQIVNKII